jgi:hypothetical protein
MTDIQSDASDTEERARAARLTARFRSLSTAGPTVDRWLLIAGAVLVPLGIALIILGWVGASRTPFGFEQTPYLISGGILGLALVFSGGFVYFTYWQTRSVREARDHQRELVASIDRLTAALEVQQNGHGEAAAASDSGFVTTGKGKMFHRPDCPVAQRSATLRSVTGKESGLKPCGICNPV